MIFNSYPYLFLFLPIALIGYQLLRNAPYRVSIGWLVLMSFIYYAWWRAEDLWVIGASCIFNFLLGRQLSSNASEARKGVFLTIGVTANLLLLGWFKYAGLFDKTFEALTGAGLDLPNVILPLGISFFTFQQIAYLVDARRGETREYHFTDYLLFVSFFPQLIAGPIVHHGEMLPQFEKGRGRGLSSRNFAIGVTIIAIGLFKKVVIADYLARSTGPIFDLAADAGSRAPTIGEAWAGALGYTLQIYFDFSGYSDIAIGSARLFGIKLPLNFHSPYKAGSIIDFWRRWHMTLSRFLRDYLYFSLGGNRKGPSRRYVNLMLTMLLGGLWHGAGWTFILWGALHGFYLCANHGWNAAKKKLGLAPLPHPVAVLLTLFAVILAWIPFRAGNYEFADTGSTTDALRTAGHMFASMFGLNGLAFWPPETAIVTTSSRAIRPVVAGLLVVLFLPNTQQFMRRYVPAIGLPKPSEGSRRRWWQWRPTLPWLGFTLGLLYLVGREFDQVSEFIYFQF